MVEMDGYCFEINFEKCDKKPILHMIHDIFGFTYMNFYSLSSFLKDQPIYSINNPYWGSDDGFKTLKEMATEYLKLIKKVQKTGPYYIGGYSMGGLIAWEVAEQFKEIGDKVELVLMIDSSAPKLDDEETKIDKNKKNYQQIKEEVSKNKKLYEGYLVDFEKRLKQKKQQNKKKQMKELIRMVNIKATDFNKNDGIFNNWFPFLKDFDELIEFHSVEGYHYDLFQPENIQKLANVMEKVLNQTYKNSKVNQILHSDLDKLDIDTIFEEQKKLENDKKNEKEKEKEIYQQLINKYFLFFAQTGDEFFLKELFKKENIKSLNTDFPNIQVKFEGKGAYQFSQKSENKKSPFIIQDIIKKTMNI